MLEFMNVEAQRAMVPFTYSVEQQAFNTWVFGSILKERMDSFCWQTRYNKVRMVLAYQNWFGSTIAS